MGRGTNLQAQRKVLLRATLARWVWSPTFEKCWMNFEVTTTKEQNNNRTYGNNDELCCKSIDVCTFVYIYIHVHVLIDFLKGYVFKKTPFPPN